MQKATHEQARNEMIRSGNDVDLVVQRYRACMRSGGGGGGFPYTPRSERIYERCS